ncbi:tRNA1(Val) (adenine(37)-N6)-methyltransferase [Actibacterium sp. XHP0104]|uniref:tRNA1(Val) (adenine(37)-N6)-methyltransferase n=1 Tax=Actibacterium sp. XHP0104 TaxID=2984335 RepID=UPI0021E95906|nr:methyltransferase [Actibacterium sp. XHP0104]MCV2883045.1 methyltransferase [Actibacterium sp. XHP0104]
MDLTCDQFLGGRLSVWQPRDGYRAGVDPVLLAAAVPAKPGQRVLELGCGVGVASLCLGARVPDLAITGVELQPDYADLARRNAEKNGVQISVLNADLRRLPTELRQISFDHVVANPPYYLPAQRTAATDAGRDLAQAGETPLSDWFDAATRRLAKRGVLTIIQRADRLPDMLSAVDARLGSIEVLPLVPRPGRDAKLVLLRAVKGGRAAFRLLPPLVLHDGERHDGDRESYTPEIRAALRNAAPIAWAS